MAWRVVSIANRSHISLRQNNLVIRQDGEFSVPLEDIGALLLEDRSITTSMALLDACIEHKVAVYVCDKKHMPSGMLLGYQQHSRQSKVIEAQMRWTEPFKKRLWQLVIVQKIKNQKTVYEHITEKQNKKFDVYINSVRSGDTLNREASAARLYFKDLLPEGCTRSAENVQNHALNYGYAIIRGAIARSIVAYGFLSSVGIQHSNELNNFALADDLIEPYRPFVDKYVFENISKNKDLLEKEDRDALIALLTEPTQIAGKNQTLMRAIELTAQSLVTATTEKDHTRILLPDLCIKDL